MTVPVEFSFESGQIVSLVAGMVYPMSLNEAIEVYHDLQSAINAHLNYTKAWGESAVDAVIHLLEDLE